MWLDSTTPISIRVMRNLDNEVLSYPYDNFKIGMGLEDMRFAWLLGENNFIAGGAVMNWVWQEGKNEDVDFFFKNRESADMFVTFLESIGSVEKKSTSYARTLFNKESKAIMQVVGPQENKPVGPVAFGTVEETISRFDIDVCKFAIDVDNIYFTQGAILDLIRLTIEANDSMRAETAVYRISKYLKKGFHLGATLADSGAIRYEPGWFRLQR